MALLDDFKVALANTEGRLLEQMKQTLKEFQPQKPCLGEECPNRKAAELITGLAQKLDEIKETVAVKIPNPKEEKVIPMDEALRMALDDIIEKGKHSPYWELFDKRKEQLLKEEKGEPEKTKEPISKSWC